MSYTESAERLGSLDGSEAPVFGGGTSKGLSIGKSNSASTKVVIRYYVANMSDDGDRRFIETLMTRSFDCKDVPKAVGDIAVIRESENFDREGNYNLLVKYLELVPVASSVEKKAETDKLEVESTETEELLSDIDIMLDKTSEVPKHDY